MQCVQVECGGAESGQVYLDKCYITYSYYPQGVPRAGASGLGGTNLRPFALVDVISLIRGCTFTSTRSYTRLKRVQFDSCFLFDSISHDIDPI